MKTCRFIGVVVIAALVAVGCGGNASSEQSKDHIEDILALAKKSAEEGYNVNFYGFFTGMSRYDAIDLASYYKLKEGEYSISADPGKAVSRLWISLQGVRRITKGGNTLDALAQAVANRVGNLKKIDDTGEYEQKTIDGVVVRMDARGLSIQNDGVASQSPLATEVATRKYKADVDAEEKAAAEEVAREEKAAAEEVARKVARLIRDMVAIPGKNFKMGKYEVTQAQWQAIMGDNPSSCCKCLDHPVENVSWYDCKKFLEKLNAIPEVRASGLRFRLPTEAEWEYACRAGGTGHYCRLADGTEITKDTLGKVAWYDDTRRWQTYPVGEKEPNAFGLYDMHGNVFEWCEDLYRADSSNRVCRGGYTRSPFSFCTAGRRGSSDPDDRSYSTGFRLAAADKADVDAVERAAAEEAARKERAAKEQLFRLIRDMVAIPGKNFKMGKYEVTQAQWQVVMGENPSGSMNSNNPVENVSWDDCKKFLEKLNAIPEVSASGLRFRLPTEAEWEYACRAGGTGHYCRLADGTEITKDTLGKVAWYDDNSESWTHPVGQKEPNAFGFYDMHGNVREWCEDLDRADSFNRVIRGGCINFNSRRCAACDWSSDAPGRRNDFLGFRLAAEDRDAAKRAAAEEAARKEIVVKESLPRLIRDMVAIPGKSFKMGKYEVTQAQWQVVMGENPSRFKNSDNPVENVSWDDCEKFLEKLNALPEVRASGLKFRLPTEDEWEYACRAGGTNVYCRLADGTEITKDTLGKVAWYDDNSERKTHPVGQKEPNAFGLYDMYGNVREWCEGHDFIFDIHPEYRGCAGGSWDNASGGWAHRTHRDNNLGFRLAAGAKMVAPLVESPL